MLKSWSNGDVPVCEHARPACERCIIDYALALITAHRELMLQSIWQAREILTNGEGTVRQVLDRFETLEETTANIHNMFEKAFRRDPDFVSELRKVREYCRCKLPW